MLIFQETNVAYRNNFYKKTFAKTTILEIVNTQCINIIKNVNVINIFCFFVVDIIKMTNKTYGF